MFQSRIRKASAQARPVRISGVALTSVSDRTPMLPNDAFRMWRYEAIGSPPTIAMIAPGDQQRDDERAERQGRREPAGDGQARLEADRHAGSRAPRRRDRRGNGSAGRRLGAAGHQQPDVGDVRLVARERPDDPPLVDHVDAVRQGEDLVELLRDQEDRGALRAQVEQQPMDRLDRPDVEPARRLDRDEQPGVRLDLPGEDRPLEVAAGQQPDLRVDRRRGDPVRLLQLARRSPRAVSSSTSQPRATGASR